MSHTGHAQVRKATWPLFIVGTLLVSILLSLTSCMTADPQRSDGYDDYDRKVAVAPVQVTKMALTPEKHLIVLVQFAHIFTKSQPDPEEARYVARAHESRLFVYDGRNWQSTGLENYFEYGHHQVDFYYWNSNELFDYDTEMQPVLQSLEKISPIVLAYRNRQWQTIWRGETRSPSPLPCQTQNWFLDGNLFCSFCDNPYDYTTPIKIADSRGQKRIIDSDTLQTRIELMRVRGDTLDFISYSMDPDTGFTMGSQRYTWNRILRKTGLSFADSSNSFKQWPIPTTFVPRNLNRDPNNEFYTAVENGQLDGSQSIHVMDVKNDSVVLNPTPLNVPLYFTPYQISKNCIRNYRSPQISWAGNENPSREPSDTLSSGAGAYTFAFHSTCDEAPDTLRFSRSADILYQGSRLLANREGKVWAFHRLLPKSLFQPPSYQEDFLSHHQNTPSDSLEAHLRREFAHRLTHWNGQAWQDLPWPF